MKTKLFTIALLFFGIKSFGQTTANLDINNIIAPLNADGDLFRALPNHKFEAPKGSGLSTIFESNLWIGGYGSGNQLKVAGQTYRQSGSDFWPGPLDTVTVSCPTSVSTSPQWNRVWKINKTTIDSFKLGFFQTIPQIILDWPGNGTGQQYHILAPFHDNNSNSLYEPSLGDYPIIKGDQAVYFIFNDRLQGSTHTETGGNSFGIEIHAMAYAFKCSNDSALNNTIFLNYKIYHMTYFQDTLVHVGIWTDFDIGLYSDDFIGSDVTRQCYYGYNGDSIDLGGYGSRLPAQAVVFLNGVEADVNDGKDNNKNCIVDEPGETCLMSNFVYYNNDASPMGNPNLPIDYYNYLNGKWKDNTPITYGGNGHGTGPQCNYMFPDVSDQQFGWGLGGSCNPNSPIPSMPWSEITSNDFPGDRRGLASSGAVTMKAGEVFTLDLAFVFGRDYTSGGVQQSLNVMDTRVDSIRSYFSHNSTPCGNIFNTAVADDRADQNTISIYPNPTSDILNISFSEKIKNAVCEIYDVTGKKMLSVACSPLSENKIDVSSFASGLYFIRIIDASNIYLKKFIKK